MTIPVRSANLYLSVVFLELFEDRPRKARFRQRCQSVCPHPRESFDLNYPIKILNENRSQISKEGENDPSFARFSLTGNCMPTD
jgi:hypothetical protein